MAILPRARGAPRHFMTIRESLTTLPEPTPEERAHSARVEQALRAAIHTAGGFLSFAQFMRLALYAPGLGYYRAGSTKIGAAGDFVTAPALSTLFGRCVARQCAEVLAQTGGDILELGAGSGALAETVLAELRQLGALPERYRILEVSADFVARQRERLARLPPELASRVEWISRWPHTRMHGVLLANEVLDAMPVERFVVLDARGGERVVRALGVGLDADGRLVWRESAPSPELEALAQAIISDAPRPLPEGYVGEICTEVTPWIAGLAAALERGVALLIDYGLPRWHLYHPDRMHGTLQCHYRHRAHDDPLIHVGIQDITAWVDFTRVAEAADAAHLEVLGFVTQAAFLLGNGVQNLLAAASTERERAALAGEARRLLLPGEMGEAFKVMALSRNFHGTLRGLQIQDLRGSL
jgi:SAM-dependent MidA family methyltransferase